MGWECSKCLIFNISILSVIIVIGSLILVKKVKDKHAKENPQNSPEE